MTQPLEDAESQLRHIIAQFAEIPLWPPSETVASIEGLVRNAWDVASVPPAPDPAVPASAAQTWNSSAASAGQAAADAAGVGRVVDPMAWQGNAGDAMRSSVQAYSGRIGTVQSSSTVIAQALHTFADDMTQARAKHADGAAMLGHAVWIPPATDPFTVLNAVYETVSRTVTALDRMASAYADAGAAAANAGNRIRIAADDVAMPPRTGPGIDAVDTINGWTGATSGPLKGSVLDRAAQALDGLSPADRARAEQLLATAPDAQHKAWILAALAGGANPDTLANFAGRIAGMTPTELAQLDPSGRTGWGTDRRSPFLEGIDGTTCAPDALVMARMINDPVYALQMMTGFDSATGTGPTGPSTDEQIHARFLTAADQLHHSTNGWVDHTGTPQIPWPEAAGTLPSGASGAMNGRGGAGVPGATYGFQPTDPADRGSQYDRIAAAASNGHAVPLYVGSAQAPRHVALVTGTDGPDLTVYDPIAGLSRQMTRSNFTGNTLGVGGWPQAWGAVLPE